MSASGGGGAGRTFLDVRSTNVRRVAVALLVVLLAAAVAHRAAVGAAAAVHPAASAAPRAPAPPPTLLVVTETAGYRHGPSIRQGLIELRRLAPREGVRVREITHFQELTPADYADARGIVLLQTSGSPPFDAGHRAALLTAVRGGLPLLAFHAATDTFHEWAAFHRLLGADFSDHPNVGPGRLRIEDRGHPATRGMRSGTISEEWYRFRPTPDPRRTAHVLASLDVASVGGRPVGDRPLVWWRTEGRGRVFYSALGHAAVTWRTARHRALLRGALDWALARTR